MWITCGEVRSNIAPRRENQHQYPCPSSHEEFENLKRDFLERQAEEQTRLSESMAATSSPEDTFPSPQQSGGSGLTSSLDRLSSDFSGSVNIGSDSTSYYGGPPQTSPFGGLGWEGSRQLDNIGGYGNSPDVGDYMPDAQKDTGGQDYSHDQDPKRQHKSSKSHFKSSDSYKKGHGSTSHQSKHSRGDKSSSKSFETSISKKVSKNRPEDSSPSHYSPEQSRGPAIGYFDEDIIEDDYSSFGGGRDILDSRGEGEGIDETWPSYDDPPPPNKPSGGGGNNSRRHRR